MKKIKWVFVILLVTILVVTEYVYADSSSMDWWEQAYKFWSGSTSTVATNAMNKLGNLTDFIKAIGNAVFIIVTVILGAKYIWGSVESKASIKDSLMTLIVAALVFYGWDTISTLFTAGKNLVFVNKNYDTTVNSIYSTILYIVNFFAVGGIVYVGVRYMMAGAEGRAQLKTKSVPIVLGIIMVYATITFLNIIVGFTDVISPS